MGHRLGRAFARFAGLFDSVRKIVGAVAAVVALLAAFGLWTFGGDSKTAPKVGKTEVPIDTSEIRAFATVRSLARQDDPRGANDYQPDNMLDGDVHTGWADGVTGLPNGARLTFRLERAVDLTGLRIVNGYAKSKALLLDNGAARTILISTDSTRAPLRRTLSRRLRPQVIRGALGKTRNVTIEIVSAYRGDRFEAVVISEVYFLTSARSVPA